jgi:hypothetical protein
VLEREPEREPVLEPVLELEQERVRVAPFRCPVPSRRLPAGWAAVERVRAIGLSRFLQALLQG